MEIKCKCGVSFDKSYKYATVGVVQEEEKSISVYLWTCKNCGQEYSEKKEKPIEL